jgi:beta-galactosidase
VFDSNAAAVDSVTQSLGVRSIRIDANKGFYLNESPLDLHGVNMHQDRLDQGDVCTPTNAQQDVGLIQELGATMVRLAHDQHSQATYDLLDRAGIVAWSEIPIWGTIGADKAFKANAKEQLSELILQNYNHPSVCFWGIFNEVSDSSANASVVEELKAHVKSTDPTRIVVAASNSLGKAQINAVPDALGWNVYYGWYNRTYSDVGDWLDQMRAMYPNLPLGMSEYGAGGSINQHTDNGTQPNPGGHFHPEEYQNLFHENYWAQLKARSWLWCKLIWQLTDTGSDVRGEGDTPGRNDKGLVTYDRKTKKDTFYFYKANWSSQPVLYITDRRFTNRTNPKTTIKIYSNCDAVTLSVNGKLIGNMTAQANHIFVTSGVVLAPGKNTIAVTANRNGKSYQDGCQWTLAQK